MNNTIGRRGPDEVWVRFDCGPVTSMKPATAQRRPITFAVARALGLEVDNKLSGDRADGI
jgi:hypothetical protein